MSRDHMREEAKKRNEICMAHMVGLLLSHFRVYAAIKVLMVILFN